MSERNQVAGEAGASTSRTVQQVLGDNAVELMYENYARHLCNYDVEPEVKYFELTADGAIVEFCNGKRVEMSKF